MNTARQNIYFSVKRQILAIVLALSLLAVTTAVSNAAGKRNVMQQETSISFGLAGKKFHAKSGTPCVTEIDRKVTGLLETSNDTYDVMLNAQQIAEWKIDKDWVEIHFAKVKNIHIGYLKQNANVGTILVFFRSGKPQHIVWGGENFSPEQANVAANTVADQSLHDSLLVCGK